jgi:membrane protease YdiL (CAAX protease family)
MVQIGSRSLLPFFVLVFALSLPFYAVGAATGRQLTADLPISSFIWVCPMLAAAILVAREDGAAGVRALLKRSVDVARITSKPWLLAVVLPAAVFAATYGVMRVLSLPLPAVHFPPLAALGWFIAFFVAAEAEELGWSGYALDPLRARWGALGAALLLGVVWAAFHLVPLLQAHRAPEWIAWWALGTVALRLLLVWIYDGSGGSVFAVALAHALTNLVSIGPFLDFGPGGYPLAAQRISALLMAIAAAAVGAVWGPRALARSPGGERSVAPGRSGS